MIHNEDNTKTVLELKAISRALNGTETTQLKKYFHQLKKTNIEVKNGLIINFNPLEPKELEHLILQP